MKKLSTLVMVVLATMNVCAQTTEKWDATTADLNALTPTQNTNAGITSGGDATTPGTDPLNLSNVVITAKTTSVTMSAVSTPNSNEESSEAWQLKGNGGNEALNTADCSPAFTQYISGKGNPSLAHWEYEEETDNGTSHRIADTYWAPGNATLPVKGAYYEFKATTDGTLKIGVYVTKNLSSRPIYIIDESTGGDTDGYQVLANTDIKAEGFLQNNGFTYNDATYQAFPLSADYIIVSQNRPFLGYLSFTAKANKTYMLLTPQSQIGLYGFEFTPVADGITSTEANVESSNAATYSLLGQKVGADYKGVVIKNGKKYIQK